MAKPSSMSCCIAQPHIEGRVLPTGNVLSWAHKGGLMSQLEINSSWSYACSHSPGGKCSLKRNFSLLVKDPQYKVSAGGGSLKWNEFKSCINGKHGRHKCTQRRTEFLKVDEAILVLIYQAEDPETEGALGCAEGPGLQQGEEQAELVVTQLVLFQISLTGVMMEQSGTLYFPITGEEMLPLIKEKKKKSEKVFC